jgi:hypothetical protein
MDAKARRRYRIPATTSGARGRREASESERAIIMSDKMADSYIMIGGDGSFRDAKKFKNGVDFKFNISLGDVLILTPISQATKAVCDRLEVIELERMLEL